MSDERKPSWPWIVALLIGLPVLNVASYGFLLGRTAWVFKAPFPGDAPLILPRHAIYAVTIPWIGSYSMGEEGLGHIFALIHRLDRKLRPEYWTFRIDPT